MKACGIRSCLTVIQVSSMMPTINRVTRNTANNSKGGQVETPLDIHHPINKIRNGHLVIPVTNKDIHRNINPVIQVNQVIPVTLNNRIIQGIRVIPDSLAIKGIPDIINSMETTIITKDTNTMDSQEVNRSKVRQLPLLQTKYRAIRTLIYALLIPAV
ncbi:MULTISPECIES: hypothetical protein [unclassified Sporosarcina]|uniref:hypothetical protein n=1 Tax=unclassified Sporosarcina TaxID=2647733 RepID=UPI001304659C|nr:MULTISPECIES: hypothetical protein [unclassified Sporosarcina]